MGVSKKYSTTNWGYGTKYDVQNIFLNFEKVLNYPLITQRTNASVFDGAGSLIKPDGSCYGCDKDAADMQSHDIPSTVVFQWKSIDNCNYLNIGVSDDWKVGDSPLDVVIHTKYWDDHKSISYKTTLPISVRSEGVWNTTAITSQKKLSSSVRLIAECSKTAMQGGGEDIANKFVDLSNGYLWAGNGSIITRALDSKTTGRTQDWAEVFDKNKSMTAFQWDASSACSSLLLEPDWEGVTGQENVIQVDMKSWSQEKWPDNHLCNGKLPCTINAPDNNYYIIKIKTKGGEISSGLIHAKCI